MESIKTLILTLTLSFMGAFTSNVMAQSDPDDLIFKSSFEEIDNGSLIFLTENNAVFDNASPFISVKATRAENQLDSISINGITGRVINQDQVYIDYEVEIELVEGENTITAVADYGFQVLSEEITVYYYPAITIDITSPTDWETLGPVGPSVNEVTSGGALNLSGVVERPVTISGTTSRPVRNLNINQQQADINGTQFTFEKYFLHEGSNLISATATDEYGRRTTSSITVYVDQTAPLLILDDTFDQITSANKISITGTINDAVEADFNAPEALVAVRNLSTGQMHEGLVEGINFVLTDIDLVVGENNLLITGADAYGNESTQATRVSRINVGTDRLSYFSGNWQSAPVNEYLAQPLQIAAFDKSGLPLSAVPVRFEVVKGSGTISHDDSQATLIDGVNPARNLVVMTDDNGEALVWVKVGSEAGLASHVIKAWSDDLSEAVYFSASSTPGEPHRVLIEDGSGTQYAQNNTVPLHSPTVVVLDANDNPLPGVPVKFSIVTGDATFDEDSAIGGVVDVNGSEITTITDKKGQASVRPLIGSQSGVIEMLAQALDSSNETTEGVTFQIMVKERKDDITSFNGLVMDMSGYPLEGVSLSFARTNLTTLTDAEGQFYFQGDLPIGRADLFIDGRNVSSIQNGQTVEYPALHFEATIIEGQDNQLPHIIYLPPVHTDRAKLVGGSEDVSLTIPGYDGFEMIVKAGSVTFPDGSTTGELVVNPVHADRLPMVPPGGSGRFSPFGWTIQPTGTRFDPPIEVRMPNVNGLKPGITRPIVQWDHDLAQFVPMGLGTVSADGTQLISRPGSGITKAGWGGPPQPTETNDGDNPSDEDEGEPRDPREEPEGDDTEESDQNPNEGADPITLSTGEFKTSVTDLKIKGRGFDFDFIRTYRSQYKYNGPIGENWNHNHNDKLLIDNNQVKYARGDGRIDTFTENPDGTFQTPDSLYMRLMNRGSDGYILRDRYGFRTLFDAAGLMTARIDRKGNRMDYRYDDLDRLITIIDTLGRRIEINYYSSHRIRSVRDFTGREVVYSYDQNNDLISVRSPIIENTSTGNDFPDGLSIKYTYSSGQAQAELNHNLLTITDAKNQTYLVNTYGDAGYEFDKVIIQQEGEQDQTYELTYIDVTGGSPENPNEADNQVTLVDRMGNVEVHVHNARGNLLEKRELTNRNINPMDDDEYITRHRYDVNGERIETTYPEGNKVQWSYDSNSIDPLRRGNLIKVTKIAGPRGAAQATLEQAYQYEPVFNQLLSSIDARAFAAEFIPPNGGDVSEERYKTTYQFDYQENTPLIRLVQLTGLSATDLNNLLTDTGVTLDLGDLNVDENTDQLMGNKIVKLYPNARDFDGVEQIIRSEYQYNDFGQLTAEIDPEGNVDEYRYHAEIDPGGSGIASESERMLNIETGGHIRKKVRDARTSLRRADLPLESVEVAYRYNQAGQITSITDGRGHTTLIERNAVDRPIKITAPAPLNYTKELHYDPNGNIIRLEIENRDTNGPNLDESVTTLFTYDMLDNPVEKREEVAANKIITTTIGYNANEKPNLLTKGEGNQIKSLLDERDHVFSITRGFGSADASTVNRTYDGNGNLISKTDAGDNNGDGEAETTAFTYDGYDRMIEMLDAVGNKVIIEHDPVNLIEKTSLFGSRGGPTPIDNTGLNNELLAESIYQYDELKRLYQFDRLFEDDQGNQLQDGTLTPDDGYVSTQYRYDRSSRRISVTDDNSNITSFAYDGIDRRINLTDALDNEIDYAYDANNNLVQLIQTEKDPIQQFVDETFHWNITYDELNRSTLITDNLNNPIRAAYDSRNNLIRRIDPMGNISRYVYDGQDRLIRTIKELSESGAGGDLDTTNPANSDGLVTVRMVYDDNSRITALIDDANNSTVYLYDALDRLEQKTWPDSTFESYIYDNDDNLRTLTDPNGSVHTITYDGINRMSSVEIMRAAGMVGTTSLSYEYDGLSRRTRLEDNNNPDVNTDDWVLTVAYDSLNRAITQNQNGQTVSSLFDGLGNQTSLTYPSGREVKRNYDGLNRLEKIIENDNDLAAYRYMGFDRIIQRELANGTSWKAHDDTAITGFDEVKRLISMEHTGPGDTLISQFNYGYDAAGNRRFETEQTDTLLPAVSKLITLDSAYRADTTVTQTQANLSALINNQITNAALDAINTDDGNQKRYQLDGVGNWDQVTAGTQTTDYTVNELNQYTQIDGVNQDHDADGNLIVEGERTLEYDALDRLVNVKEQGITLASFTYDALSRRVSKTTQSDSTFYYHDRYRVIEEQDASNTTLRTFIQGVYLDEMVQMQTPANDYYYHNSIQHSVAAITDSSGQVVERYRYGDFGQTEVLDAAGSVISQSAIGNPFGYTGRRLDTETGYYYYRARYFSPERGRFLNRDPIGYIAGMNLYTYVGNNPLMWIDPLGFDKAEPNLIEDFLDMTQEHLDAVEVVLEKIELDDDIWPKDQRDLLNRLVDIAKTEKGEELFDRLQPEVDIRLTNKETEAVESMNLILFNYENGYFEGVEGSKIKFDPTQVLAHELGHLVDHPPFDEFDNAYPQKLHEQMNIDNWENPIVKELFPRRELRKEWGGRYEND